MRILLAKLLEALGSLVPMRSGHSKHHPDEKPCEDDRPLTRRDLVDFEVRVLTALSVLTQHVVDQEHEDRIVLDKVLKTATKDTKALEKLAKPD